jgi:hypothetical protein
VTEKTIGIEPCSEPVAVAAVTAITEVWSSAIVPVADVTVPSE